MEASGGGAIKIDINYRSPMHLKEENCQNVI